ncbi:hypothetical protein E4U15_006969 [Claviceps sp. LM218 group G6]|nr:hypothetical protein E4U15_006969 [Claviceps sp. LM218 group G6]
MVPQHLTAKGAKEARREEEQHQAIDARLDKEDLKRYPLVSTCFGDTAGGVRISSVEWKPLNAASIQKARWENKLLFLHIGYPGCHDCRLMLSETFLNADCAAILNESFVPVIVDRDERPDIDMVYMNALLLMKCAIGCPLNVFVTPDLEPVFGGTYWPGPSPRMSENIGARDSLAIFKKVQHLWSNEEAKCRMGASDIMGKLRIFTAKGVVDTRATGETLPVDMYHTSDLTEIPEVTGDVRRKQLQKAYAHMVETYDPAHGGFGLAPKFPNPQKLSFLLELCQITSVLGERERNRAAYMATETLRKIRDGAMHDHIGAMGFTRCSVTRNWSVPKFEKLLVDNIMLLELYLTAWRGSGGTVQSEFFDTVIELSDYLTSPLVTLPDGGLITSKAADCMTNADLKEGTYYLWTWLEFQEAIDPPSAIDIGKESASLSLVAAHWDIREGGNIPKEYDPHGDFSRLSIPRVVKTPQQLSQQFGLSLDAVKREIDIARGRLRNRRDDSVQRGILIPAEDDMKFVTSWNGLAISALTKAYYTLRGIDVARSRKFLDRALRIAKFIKDRMWSPQTETLRRIWVARCYTGRYTIDATTTEGFADDYAYVIRGLLDLKDFNVTGYHWAEFALQLQKAQVRLFCDEQNGGFFSTTLTLPHSVLRLKEGMDGSLPSVNAVTAANLLRLSSLYKDKSYSILAHRTSYAFRTEVPRYPWMFPGMLLVPPLRG